jgi:hypothetical protein
MMAESPSTTADPKSKRHTSDDRRFCRNVDEALAALHPANDEYATHQLNHLHLHERQMYQEEYDWILDWILDGHPEHDEEECRKSLQLMKQLNYGDESVENSEEDDNDEDFGDFQSMWQHRGEFHLDRSSFCR